MNKPSISIENNVEMRIIYIRFRGTYLEFRKSSNKLFKELFAFAEKNDLIIPEVTKVMTIYNDNPFITGDNNLRTSIAMTIPKDVEILEEGQICVSSLSGKFAIGHFDISLKEYEEAWKYMYEEWLFKGDQTPRDSIPFELYVTEPPKNFKGKSLTDIYIPIE
ncbi:AraC family transcriptional regulator [Peptostreptococcus faecalis]|uniref:AraC family transcriptional regulator n=1 Tax=Peptostreptococcus faecalis TaxID=2045015 RepID=UPI000C79FF81|nr:GyrI-like domain-containing protein [Peptostreptococcus faecalis]